MSKQPQWVDLSTWGSFACLTFFLSIFFFVLVYIFFWWVAFQGGIVDVFVKSVPEVQDVLRDEATQLIEMMGMDSKELLKVIKNCPENGMFCLFARFQH